MNEPDLSIEDQKYSAIRSQIEDSESPVGIDAAKTHINILNKLLEIEARLDNIEQKLD